MELLQGVVQHYDWGSATAIPDLLGLPATGEPWAELWLGAHPSAPALVGPGQKSLDELVAADPVAALGSRGAERFGRLPFLLKVLAADRPLSLQAHPSSAQAEAGFERENRQGIPLDAPNRSFRDRSHKPELICGLTEFDALCGFRDPHATSEVLATIDTEALDPVRDRLATPGSVDGLAAVLEHLLTLDGPSAAGLCGAVVDACRGEGPPAGAGERAMVVDLGGRYPGDAGVVIALLLNLVRLQPGEALFLGAGNLHAYLRGTAIEVMASSDNVLRGGLTSKHVDIPALLEVVDPAPVVPEIQRPGVDAGVAVYSSPAPEFCLRRLEVDGTVGLEAGPSIVLCTSGTVHVGLETLDRGAAAWIPASDGPMEMVGHGTVFQAGVGAA